MSSDNLVGYMELCCVVLDGEERYKAFTGVNCKTSCNLAKPIFQGLPSDFLAQLNSGKHTSVLTYTSVLATNSLEKEQNIYIPIQCHRKLSDEDMTQSV